MKILALDVGDRWTGTAISDPLLLFARPYQTVTTDDLEIFLTKTIAKEGITTVVVGLPTTMRGQESQQTKKVQDYIQQLQQIFPAMEWKFWDERLSSHQASRLKQAKTKQDKVHSHSIAAAIILGSYLDHLNFQRNRI